MMFEHLEQDDDDNFTRTSVSKPTSNIVRDYEEANLLKAFPLQFPYGNGEYDLNENSFGGIGFYQYLKSLSNPVFHTPVFCCILHNVLNVKGSLHLLSERLMNLTLWNTVH